MSGSSWLELIFLFVLLAISTPLLGSYMAKVYGNEKAPGDRFFLPVERWVYRVCRIDPDTEQRWRTYVISMLLYTLVGGLLTYGVLRLQQHLPGNPDGYPGVSAGVSFNTAISFMTNTNWQNYAGESTMSQFSQMVGLVWHQFISAVVGPGAGPACHTAAADPVPGQRARGDGHRRGAREAPGGGAGGRAGAHRRPRQQER